MKNQSPRRARRLLLRLLAAMVLALGSFTAVSVVAPGSALACTDNGCNSTNPQSSGCSSTAAENALNYIYNGAVIYGLVESRYSTTCQSQWTRVRDEHNGPPVVGNWDRDCSGDPCEHDVKLQRIANASHTAVNWPGPYYTACACAGDTYQWSPQYGALNTKFNHGADIDYGVNNTPMAWIYNV